MCVLFRFVCCFALPPNVFFKIIVCNIPILCILYICTDVLYTYRYMLSNHALVTMRYTMLSTKYISDKILSKRLPSSISNEIRSVYYMCNSNTMGFSYLSIIQKLGVYIHTSTPCIHVYTFCT